MNSPKDNKMSSNVREATTNRYFTRKGNPDVRITRCNDKGVVGQNDSDERYSVYLCGRPDLINFERNDGLQRKKAFRLSLIAGKEMDLAIRHDCYRYRMR